MDTKGRLETILLHKIELGERARKDYKDVDHLWEKIQEKGLIHPIAVHARDDGKYDLLAGGRRLMAHVFGNATSIMCRVYDGEMTPIDMKEIELIENIEREDLSYIEIVALKLEIHNLRVSIEGEAVGPSPGHSIADTARLLKESKGLTSEDLQLARAIQTDPSLAQQKNKSAAKRLLKKKLRDVASQVALDKHHATIAAGKGDVIKNALVNCYIVKDCFQGLAQIPDNSVNLVEIDPPYALDLQRIRRNETDRNALDAYNEISVEDYPEFLEKITKESHRILVEGGWMIFWFALHPWYQEVLTKIQAADFTVFGLPAYWFKPGSPGQTSRPETRLGSVVEPFFYAMKGDGVLYHPGTSNVFEHLPIHPTRKIHPTERPIPLMEDLITLFSPPSGNVVVPFLGSGNTLLACSNTGRKGIGFDLSEQYKVGYSSRVLNGNVGSFHIGA